MRRAAAVIASNSAVILGVESDPGTGMVYEIAAVDTRGKLLIDTLINPGVAVESKNLTDQMLAGAPSFGQVLADLLIYGTAKSSPLTARRGKSRRGPSQRSPALPRRRPAR